VKRTSPAGALASTSSIGAAQGVPFAREYGGLLAIDRSAARVCEPSTPAGTGQQLLLGYQSMMRQVDRARHVVANREMLDLVIVNSRAAARRRRTS
jgi:succinate dehydrogenase / fumarate reductase flavoprotein subunit